ncbi:MULTISPECIES: DinB family protein [Brevibacterium]|uniref:Mini-circle protein n=2 Tax=Brevibacterium casei TaxID=33889 RepID=K9AJT3_9MICO|nr:DinB family protein [Brevibacterium casei]NJE67823.1 DinB family protein [Brevibacterium sp. LS14]SIG62174.1 Protein of uncharacterised function (DUF664) [Mycobacteroides abscessus subsp. abscessus]EKU47608.1 Mini-circle protein [Brevibacterium casei S18]KZE17041.1 Mini-circle protein [Brevibacterium casei]MBE4694724.1 DinB family protein [Brevibacterium casei]
MPFFAPPVTTETDAQLSFLEQQCQQLRLTAAGLTDEQARSTPTVSSLSIAGLLAHSAHVVYGWLQQVRDPSLVATEEDYAAFGEELGLLGSFEGATLPDLTLAEVLAAFDRAVAEITATRTQAAADGIDLDAKVPVNNPWMPKDFDMSVRWILAHLNTEIARHAGHADIIRESIDGAVSYQLNAQAEGLPWPPEG